MTHCLPMTRRALAAAFAAAAGAGLSGARAQGRPVVVASKIDTEGALLGNMILLVLEHAKIPVEARIGLGPTKIVRGALTAGEIDVYPEYTGNAGFFHDKANDPVWKDAAKGYAEAKRLDAGQGLVWLDRAPANNTWLIAVRGDLAKKDKLATMADFAGAVGRGAIKLAASAEFVESAAALPAFEKTYGFNLPRDRIVVLPGGDTAVTMRAAAQSISGVNAAMVYGTDGAISALDLVVMTDPQGAQVVYEPAPVVRAATLERVPAMGPALSKVFATLDLATLQRLNARVAVDGEIAKEVARRYLAEKGFLA
jgi:osmoprotectant transport system substrate-binding protein